METVERAVPTAASARISPVARARLAWGVAIGSTILVGLAAAYSLVYDGTTDVVPMITVVLATMAFGVVGATIAARTNNGVGWALLAVISVLGVSLFAQTYATFSIVQADRPLPLTTFGAWVGTLAFFLALALIVAIPLLYPTGAPRWRWAWRLYVVATTVLVAGFAILPQELGLLAGDVQGPQNPFAIESIEGVVGGIVSVAGLTVLICAGLSVASLVVRYRASDGDERQQVKWLAYVGIAAVIAFFVNIAIDNIMNSDPQPGLETLISNGAFDVFLWIVLFGIPAACGVAILKYHLYDLDVVVRKTVVFTLVAATLTVLYLAVVTLATIGVISRVLVGIVLLAVTFSPVLRASRALADRIVYGRRASAYEVLTEFSGRVGETYATDDVLPRMALVLGKGSGATSSRVLLKMGRELRTVAVWPDGAAPGADERSVPVVHQGEELGALAVTMPRERSARSQPGAPAHGPRGAGRAPPAERPADRGAARVTPAARGRPGRGAPQDRAEPPRRRAATARRAERAARAARQGRGCRSREGGRHGDIAAGPSRRGAGGPPRPRARHLPAAARRQGTAAALEAQARKAAVPTTVVGGRRRPLPPGRGVGRLLLLPGGAEQHREVRGRGDGRDPLATDATATSVRDPR